LSTVQKGFTVDEAVDSFGPAMRALRKQRRLTLRELGERTQFSREHLGNIEKGRRAPTEDLVTACDKALRSGSRLWATWAATLEDSDVNRRDLIGLGAVVAATGALGQAAPAQASALEHSLRTAVQTPSEPVDWDALVAEFADRHVTDHTPGYLGDIQGQLRLAQYHVERGNRDATAAAAGLSLYYGLRLGDHGWLDNASGMYDVAAALAERAADPATQSFILGRAASRGIYESWSRKRTTDTVERALQLRTDGAGALEAYSARVHLCGLAGDLKGGRAAVEQMRRVADTMTDSPMLPRHAQRVTSFHNYLECRAGRDLNIAQNAHELAERDLADVPLWLADARVYWAWALVSAGDVRTGTTVALDAVRGLARSTRVLNIGIRDVLARVPAKMRRDDTVAALRMYAAPGPTPW
jgi:transcriptional regulator with XRE-family HTH domain